MANGKPLRSSTNFTGGFFGDQKVLSEKETIVERKTDARPASERTAEFKVETAVDQLTPH